MKEEIKYKTINVKGRTKELLQKEKIHRRETYNDVIMRLIEWRKVTEPQ